MTFADKNHHLEVTYTDPDNNHALRKEITKLFTDAGYKAPNFKGPDQHNMTTLIVISETDLRYLLHKIRECVAQHNSTINFTYFA